MSRPTPPSCKTENWPARNEALKRQGSLTIWFDPEMSWEAAPTGRPGRLMKAAEQCSATVAASLYSSKFAEVESKDFFKLVVTGSRP